MLTGSNPPAAADPATLINALDRGLGSANTSDLQEALKIYDASNLSQSDRANPQLNEKLARVAAKRIASGGQAERNGDPIAELKAFIVLASADPTVKDILKSDLAAKRLTTNDDTVDTELNKLL
jgi:hypothetical protein